MTMPWMVSMCEDWCQWVWLSWRWPIYMRDDNDSNVLVMITWLIWTTWTPMSKPLLQTHLICITCNAMSQLWSSWYVVSPRTMSAHKISYRGPGELGTLHLHLRWHDHVEHSDGWLKKSRNSTPEEIMHGNGHPKKTWPEETHMDCLHLGLTETHPSNGQKTWRGTLTSVIKLDPPYTRN